MAITPTRGKTNGTGTNLNEGEGRLTTEFNGSTTFAKTITQLELLKLVKTLPATMAGWKTGRYCVTIECEYVKAAAKRPATPKKAPARASRAAMH